MDGLGQLMKNHKRVAFSVNERMLPLEWMSLILLATIILSCLFPIGGNFLLSQAIIALLGTTIILLLLVLRELDSLRWQEKRWILEPICELFVQLDLIPYLPQPLIESGRITRKDLLRIKTYRLRLLPNPYPDMSGKN